MTLATHMLLTSPALRQKMQSWNIVRHVDTHRQTFQLILATITLQRYHKIWHTVIDQRNPPDTSPEPDPVRGDAHDKFTPCWLTSIIGPLSTGEVRSLITRSQ